jgi:hypothetical protein
MYTIYFKAKKQHYYLPSILQGSNQLGLQKMSNELNELGYNKLIDLIHKIGQHFNLKKNEISKLIKDIDRESVAGFVVDNELGPWMIFNDLMRLCIEQNIKNCKFMKKHDYFKTFKSKCLVTFRENFSIVDISFYFSEYIENKENNLEIIFDSQFNLKSLKATKVKYNKKSTTFKNLIRDESLMPLDIEIDKIKDFY